ncbi:pentapeptide repeat-containing protein, partial [Paraburkholderia sp. RL17-373-BIF-A]|uniref:pentapeptide repeat-containing protein n=1 Tax=Paraburkholderia sp. RL17-373-BIF-A TaxID=3031629 RepID=UPI0038BBD87A
MSVVTALTFARAFFGKYQSGQWLGGGTHEAFRRGVDGRDIPTFGKEVFRTVTANAQESMAKRAGDFDISCSRGTVTAAITLVTAFIGLLIERVCKRISSHQKEDAVVQAVVDLHAKVNSGEFSVRRPGNRSVSVRLKHGGELEVSEDTDENGTVLAVIVKTGATSESFAVEGGTIDDLKAVLEQEIVRHEADHYLYREAVGRISLMRQDLLGRGRVDLRGVDLSGVDLRWISLRCIDLGGANLSGANLSGADLRWKGLYEANLSGANLTGVALSGAGLRSANLSGVDLSGANLRRANLSGANLSEANLGGTNLSGTDLSGANLSGANLSGARLTYSELRGATLHRTTFS